MNPPRHRRRLQVPTWAIWVIAAAAGLVAAFALPDNAGGQLIDKDTAPVLGIFITAVGGLLGMVLKQTGTAEHELQPNSGSSTRDAINRIEQMLTAQGKDIGGMRSEMRDDRRAANDRFDAIDDRVTHLEQKGSK